MEVFGCPYVKISFSELKVDSKGNSKQTEFGTGATAGISWKTSLEAALRADFKLVPVEGFWVFGLLSSASYVRKIRI